MATMGVLLSFLVLFSATQVHSTQFVSDNLVRIIKKMYNPDVIPQTSQDNPVSVSLGMSLMNIRRVDIDTKEVEADAWLQLSWNSGITWTPKDLKNQTDVRLPASDIWRPDIAVYNGDLVLPENSLSDKAIISYDGRALWIPAVKIRTRCDLNEDTPDTNTTCTIKMGSWTYSGLHIDLTVSSPIEITDYFAGSKYEVLSTSTKRNVVYYSCCPEAYIDIVFTFSFCKKE